MGDYEVLSSGSVIAVENTPVTFFLDELIISFSFTKTDDEKKEMSIKKENKSQKEAVIEFVNFDFQIGCGVTSPIPVGFYKYKELSLLTRFTQLNTGGKLINYTWLTRDVSNDKKEAPNG